jgi:hypothetical protein
MNAKFAVDDRVSLTQSGADYVNDLSQSACAEVGDTGIVKEIKPTPCGLQYDVLMDVEHKRNPREFRNFCWCMREREVTLVEET